MTIVPVRTLVSVSMAVVAAFTYRAYADAILEAQLLALEIFGELRSPGELTNQIANDLALIRGTFPFIADINYLPAASPDQIIVGLTDDAFNLFEAGGHVQLNELNDSYGLIEARAFTFIEADVYTFDQVYNTLLLSELYIQA